MGEIITTWRIVWAKHAASAFSGEGTRRAGGRWNSGGIPIVYSAQSQSLAVLEILVHLEADEFLRHYRLRSATFDDSLVSEVNPRDWPGNWRQYPAPTSTRQIGDRWIASMESAVLKVPSVIVPGESNFLLNPHHPRFASVRIGEPQKFRFDRRLKDLN